MTPTDNQLLKQYADHGDQQAFARLVHKLLPIAYSAAIACLERDDLARDACQLVFVDLAKRAGHLPEAVQLGGWIHAAARNHARKILRSEIRRFHREKSYVDEMNANEKPDTGKSGSLPEIHEALSRLPLKDRNAVILRFFQDESLQDVGETLGISADAARMRINRALDRMNRHLARRGITTTAAALAATLPAQALVPVPSGLAASISTTVLTGAGTAAAGTFTLTGGILAIMKAKTILAAVAAAAISVIGTNAYYVHKHAEHPASNPTEKGSEEIATSTPVAPKTPPSDTPKQTHPPEETTPQISRADQLHIDPGYITAAEQKIEQLKITLSGLDGSSRATKSARAATYYADENPAHKLALRLNLDSAAEAKFKTILKAHLEKNFHYSEIERRNLYEPMRQELADVSDDYLACMALYIMKHKDLTLSAEQQPFYDSFMESYYAGKPEQEEPSPGEWFENEKVLAALNETLSPEQQTGLTTVVQEEMTRKREQAAYYRSKKIAKTVGLNEADRTALYTYLYNHPEAKNSDIAEQLSPELRPLVPEDIPSNYVPFDIQIVTKVRVQTSQ